MRLYGEIYKRNKGKLWKVNILSLQAKNMDTSKKN